MIFSTNILFDSTEALNYFNSLKNDFQSLSWNFDRDHPAPQIIDPSNRVTGHNGWGIQTTGDVNLPYFIDVDPHDQHPSEFKNTPLVFGFAEKVLSVFDEPFRSFLLCLPPGFHIPQYPVPPAGPAHFRVILPIVMNGGFSVVTDDAPSDRIEFKVGQVYLLETDESSYEIKNQGTSEEVLLVFQVPLNYLDKFKNLTVTI